MIIQNDNEMITANEEVRKILVNLRFRLYHDM